MSTPPSRLQVVYDWRRIAYRVIEVRPSTTEGLPDILLGKHDTHERYRGGPELIITTDLAIYLLGEGRTVPHDRCGLAISKNAWTRARRTLGIHRYLDAAKMWASRASDLAQMRGREAALQYGVSEALISLMTRREIGARRLRAKGGTMPAGEVLLRPATIPALSRRHRRAIASGQRRRARHLRVVAECLRRMRQRGWRELARECEHLCALLSPRLAAETACGWLSSTVVDQRGVPGDNPRR